MYISTSCCSGSIAMGAEGASPVFMMCVTTGGGQGDCSIGISSITLGGSDGGEGDGWRAVVGGSESDSSRAGVETTLIWHT
jgi:hypothetical protein